MTDRILDIGTADYTVVICKDDPGIGNACHEYEIRQSKYNRLRLGKIQFQNGPIKEHGVNGIANEDLIVIVMDRLEGFQSGEYKCEENEKALKSLTYALRWLRARTVKRVERGVEGTHTI